MKLTPLPASPADDVTDTACQIVWSINRERGRELNPNVSVGDKKKKNDVDGCKTGLNCFVHAS